MLSLFAASESLVLPSAAVPSMRVARVTLPAMQFDEEGGMVQDIDETIGKTWDEMKAEYGQEGPKLPDDKQAMCVLPEAEV